MERTIVAIEWSFSVSRSEGERNIIRRGLRGRRESSQDFLEVGNLSRRRGVARPEEQRPREPGFAHDHGGTRRPSLAKEGRGPAVVAGIDFRYPSSERIGSPVPTTNGRPCWSVMWTR